MMSGIAYAHSVARQIKKPPYFFSRFNFERMQERGNTHFCFHCLSDVGFTPDSEGKPTNQTGESGKVWMKCHDASHADGVIGNADQYPDPWEWLEAEIPKDFPYLVAIPAIN